NIAGRDPNRRDAGVFKRDAEEGQVSITRRGGDKATEQQLAAGIEVLDQRAGLVNVCKDRAEAPDCCRGSAIGTRHGEGCFGDVASYRSEQPRRAEGPEDFAVGDITKERSQPALGSARGRSLRKPQSGCFELAASGVQEHEERIYRGCRIQKVRVATVPV